MIYVIIRVLMKIATKPEVYETLSPRYFGFFMNLLYESDKIPNITNIAHGIPKKVA